MSGVFKVVLLAAFFLNFAFSRARASMPFEIDSVPVTVVDITTRVIALDNPVFGAPAPAAASATVTESGDEHPDRASGLSSTDTETNSRRTRPKIKRLRNEAVKSLPWQGILLYVLATAVLILLVSRLIESCTPRQPDNTDQTASNTTTR